MRKKCIVFPKCLFEDYGLSPHQHEVFYRDVALEASHHRFLFVKDHGWQFFNT